MSTTLPDFDPATTVIAFDEEGGKPIAAFVNKDVASAYLLAAQENEQLRSLVERIRTLVNVRHGNMSRELLGRKMADILKITREVAP